MTKAIRTLADRLSEIEGLESEFIHEAQAVMVLGGSWRSDLVVLGAIKRSLGLAAGFRMMIEACNFTCAAPLIRLQLDCGLRLTALTAVKDPEAYAAAFTAGQKMDKFKSASGAKLTDRFLVDRLKRDLPWVEKVYEETCAFIHLSDRALWTSVARSDEDKRVVYYQISATDPVRGGEQKYFEAVGAFRMAFLLTKTIALRHLEDRKAKLEAG